MSPYEIAARERKAATIAGHILMCFREAGDSIEPQPIASLVLELSAAGPGVRASFATGAGTKAPSAKTWLRVIELVGRQGVLAHIEAENGAEDPFEGIREADISSPDWNAARGIKPGEAAKPGSPYVPARRSRSLPPGAVLYI